MKPLLLLLVLAALAFTAACGSDDDPTLSGSSTENGAGHNDADVAFAQGMIPHHEQAIEMAQMALEKSEDPEVTDLAGRIVDAQDPEIERMKGWLEDWDEPVDGGGHNMDGASGGMMSDAEMEELEDASGDEFDELFLEMMIEHHEGAIAMAQTELDDGEFLDAKVLAREIIDAQELEIREMKRLLDGSATSTTTP